MWHEIECMFEIIDSEFSHLMSETRIKMIKLCLEYRYNTIVELLKWKRFFHFSGILKATSSLLRREPSAYSSWCLAISRLASCLTTAGSGVSHIPNNSNGKKKFFRWWTSRQRKRSMSLKSYGRSLLPASPVMLSFKRRTLVTSFLLSSVMAAAPLLTPLFCCLRNLFYSVLSIATLFSQSGDFVYGYDKS